MDRFLSQSYCWSRRRRACPTCKGLSPVAGRAGRAGGAGAADCLRERREPDDGASRGAGARDGAARHRSARDDGVWCNWCWWKAPCWRSSPPRSGRVVRLVVRAVCGRQDQSAGQSRAPGSTGRLAGAGFGLALTAGRDVSFRARAGVARLASVKPASALKGGDDPHSRRRLMHALIAAQVAFCFLVLFVAGLFVSTFDTYRSSPRAFRQTPSASGYGNETAAATCVWDQVAEHLRGLPGVEKCRIGRWAAARAATDGTVCCR